MYNLFTFFIMYLNKSILMFIKLYYICNNLYNIYFKVTYIHDNINVVEDLGRSYIVVVGT